ncbi:MAG: riboflavin synthase [Angustibacter sp.]
MFTGIVEELGEVLAIELSPGSARLTVRGAVVTADARHGASIAVDGVCLTVAEHRGDTFRADVMAETLRRSTLGGRQPGDRVNLERAMPADGRFGGHVVQGHVDGIGQLAAREPGPRWQILTIAAPAPLLRYVVVKGSVTVDGVSLTVSDVDDESGTFAVSLIPTTLRLTTLGTRRIGEQVNLEIDILAKYIERMLRPPATAPGATTSDMAPGATTSPDAAATLPAPAPAWTGTQEDSWTR